MSAFVRAGIVVSGFLALAQLLRNERGVLATSFKWLFRLMAFICLLLMAIAIGVVGYLAGSMVFQFLGWY